MRNPDDFNDMDVEGLGFGSLGGAGAEQHDTIKSRMAEDGSGFDYQIRCEKCGKTLVLTAPWPELIFMASGRLPPNNSWLYNKKRGCMMPANTCSCGEPLRIGMTPEECRRNLNAGISAQKISPQIIMQYQQQNGLT